MKSPLLPIVIFTALLLDGFVHTQTITPTQNPLRQLQNQNQENTINSQNLTNTPQRLPSLSPDELNKYLCTKKLGLISKRQKSTEGRMVKIETVYGFQMYVDDKDQAVSRSIRNYGTWQPSMISEIAHLIKPGDTILNLGSHVGLQAIVMAKIIGPQGKLFVFEPYSFSYQLVLKNLELNKLNEHSEVFQLGASDKQAVGYLHIPYQNTGSSFITSSQTNGQSAERTASEIQQVKLSLVDWVLPPDTILDFALIDVETMETEALLGMRNLINNSPNLMMLIEWNYVKLQEDRKRKAEEMSKSLLELGYRVYRFVNDASDCKMGMLIEIKQTELFTIRTVLNLLFVSGKSVEKLQKYMQKNPLQENTNRFLNTAQSPVELKPNATVTALQSVGHEQFCFPERSKFTQTQIINGSQRMQLVDTRYGFSMYIDNRDGSVSKKIKTTGSWEPFIASIISMLVRPGDNIINLGSQSGMEALIMGKRVGEKGHLFIFEPYSFSYKLVKNNIQLNKLDTITDIFNVGASSQQSTGTINVQYSNTGGSRISTQQTSQTSRRGYNEVQNITMKTVDSLIPQEYSLNFALIDVQRMEGQAILGMKEVIRRSPNLILLVEWSYHLETPQQKEYAKEAVQFLKSLNYRAYKYLHNPDMCEMGLFDEINDDALFKIRSTQDYYFFPPTIKVQNRKVKLPEVSSPLPQSQTQSTVQPSTTQTLQIIPKPIQNPNLTQTSTSQQSFSMQANSPGSNQFLCVPTASLRQNNPLDKQSNEREQLVNTKYGFNMYVDSLDKTVSSTIASTGTWQPKYISLIAHLVKPGNNILNLGSQSGLESLVMGKIVGESGHLFIFEPYSFSNKLVNDNVQLNGLKKFTNVYKIGASDQNGQGFINVRYSNTGGSEISQTRKGGSFSQQEQISLKRVDDVLPDNIKLDFALIDVQGMEPQALLGMEKILKRSTNLIIMMEWNYFKLNQKGKQKAEKAVKLLEESGFEFFVYFYKESCKIGRFTQISGQKALALHRVADIFVFPSRMQASFLQRFYKVNQIDLSSVQFLTNTQETLKENQNTRSNEGKPAISDQQRPPQFNYKCLSSPAQRSVKRIDDSRDAPRIQEVSTIYGFNMFVDRLDKIVSRSIINTGTWEPTIISMISFFVEQGDKVINLGSQSGLQAIIMGKIIGERGHLYIFQPYSISHEMVTSNIQLNGLNDRTNIYQLGASDHNGTGTIKVKYSNTGGSRISEEESKSSENRFYNEVQSVELRRVDEVLPKGTQLDFALIDVELMEGRAIFGMKQIIQNSPNLIMFVEWNYPLLKTDEKQVASGLVVYLDSLGYTYYTYTSYTKCEIGKFASVSSQQLVTGSRPINVLMLPKGLPLPTTSQTPKQLKRAQESAKQP